MALIMRQGNNQFGDIVISDEILFDNWEITENPITNAFEINNNGVNAISIANTTQEVTCSGDVSILGDVGIGTVTPNYNLHINADATSVNLQLTTNDTGELSTDGTLIGIDTSQNTFIKNQENAHMGLWTNGNERITILQNGNVGIGIGGPLTLLELGDTTPVLRLTDFRTSSGGAADIELGAIEFYNEDDTGIGAGLHARILTGTDNTDAKPEGRITFETYIDNVVSGFMVLNSSGFVGINVVAPAEFLHIDGSVVIGGSTGENGLRIERSGTVVFLQAGTIGTTSSAVDLFIGDINEDINASARKIMFKADGKVGFGNSAPSHALDIVGTVMRLDSGSTNNSNFHLETTNSTGNVIVRTDNGDVFMGDVADNGGKLHLRSAGVNRIVIDAAGLVGIGVDDPDVALEVNGPVKIVDTFTLYIGDEADARVGDRCFLGMAADSNRRLSLGIIDNQDEQCYIQFSHTNNTSDAEIGFYITSNNGVPAVKRMTLDNSGDFDIDGTLTKNAGSFDIEHPTTSKAAQGYRLRHCFVESNTCGDNQYYLQCESTSDNEVVEVDLPSYYDDLNENTRMFIQGVGHFGRAYGTINNQGTKLEITCELSGKYDILCIGTRKDDAATDYFVLGAEYEGTREDYRIAKREKKEKRENKDEEVIEEE